MLIVNMIYLHFRIVFLELAASLHIFLPIWSLHYPFIFLNAFSNFLLEDFFRGEGIRHWNQKLGREWKRIYDLWNMWCWAPDEFIFPSQLFFFCFMILNSLENTSGWKCLTFFFFYSRVHNTPCPLDWRIFNCIWIFIPLCNTVGTEY